MGYVITLKVIIQGLGLAFLFGMLFGYSIFRIYLEKGLIQNVKPHEE